MEGNEFEMQGFATLLISKGEAMNWQFRHLQLTILVLVTLLLGGCASTRMTSRVDPAFAGHAFQKIMVDGNFENLDNRQAAEDKLCDKIQSIADCECVRAMDVFFPGRKYSAEEMTKSLADAGIDGVLIIQPTNSGTRSTYIPQTSYTTSNAYVSGRSAYGSSRTTTSGGYNVDKPWANYEASLYSVSNGEVVWYATARSGGNAYADWHDLIRSASGKAVDMLVADGVLPPRRSVYPAPNSKATNDRK